MVNNGPEIHRDLTAEAVSKALKWAARADPNRMAWIGQTADLASIPEETFKDYFYGRTAPSLTNWGRIVCAIPDEDRAEFASICLAGFGLAAIRAEDLTTLAAGDVFEGLRALRGILSNSLQHIDTVLQQGKDPQGEGEEDG